MSLSGNVVARWESTRGKHWVDLIEQDDGSYWYKTDGGMGHLGKMDASEAIRQMEKKLEYLTPDDLKRGLRRAKNPPEKLPPFDEINLDAMDIEELSSFSMAIRGLYPRRAASQLFPGQTASSETVRMLKQYADNKVTAMMLRERGVIFEALRYEKIADEIYDRLPEYAKW